MAFDIMDHPICFSYPERTTESAWTLHVPIAMLLIDLVRPAQFVELGTHTGLSYCAFCQAVKELGADTRCYAVDTWRGDEHSGLYGAEILDDLRSHHDLRYHEFSRLIQSTFDDAVAEFADRSIDLLHIDGYHTYEAVSHDFNTWLPKMSSQGVVVLHDTSERGRDFGVWQFWDELKQRYPHFEVLHGHGLGIVAVGTQAPDALRELLELDGAHIAAAQQFFFEMGMRIESREEAELQHDRAEQSETKIQDYKAKLADAEQARNQAITTVDYLEELLRSHETAQASDAKPTRELEQSLTEWRARATIAETTLEALRNTRTIRAVSVWWRFKARRAQLFNGKDGQNVPSQADYNAWFLRQRAKPNELEEQRTLAKKFIVRPLISFVVPVYNPKPETLRDTIASVQAQSYENWELCIADGHSTTPGVWDVIRRSAEKDSRIRVAYLDKNLGISGNSNEALRLARGEFVSLLDHDDIVEPDLLYYVVEALNLTPRADVLYFDEDKASADGKSYEQPMFKPDWSPELLLSTPFPTHSIIRRQLVIDVDGFDSAADGAQDWDLFLRLSERTNNFVHIPRVLYHWRMVAGSAASSADAKPYVWERQRLAVQGHVQRSGHPDAHAYFAAPGILRVVWEPQHAHVSIIIPTKDKVSLLRKCLKSIQTLTSYNNYDIVLVDTGSTEPATAKYYASLAFDNRIKIVRFDGEFNYSRVCNFGAQNASGDLFLFLNNDVEALDQDWLEELVRWAGVPGIGIIGAKLLYPDEHIQHAGIVVGMGGVAGHMLYGHKDHVWTMLGSVDWYRNCSAVTGALHMMRREVFDAVGGYDEEYDVSFSDVAMCLQAIKQGYRVLYDPFVRLIHHESQTRDRTPSQHDIRLAGKQMSLVIEAGDPFFNPNLSYSNPTPSLISASEISRLTLLQRVSVG